ncbi:DUF1768-domain-containing protein [Periconia macrospinosa]|uniref:DUF1768-domain-containing protein n=1 Tax=Periconia macrospinosa TaxID=97972 RepID=A0A2V1DHG5_9PLEO|nr:DUF1768-domain-containing protein [Periconia macrospinosa]
MANKAQQNPKQQDTSKGPIFFDEARGENGWLSPMYASKFSWREREYLCVEQVVQCCKAIFFNKKDISQALLNSENPDTFKSLSKQLDTHIAEQGDSGVIESWNKVAMGVMAKVNYAKFTASDDAETLRDLLLKTGDRELVAISEDEVWGCGMTWSEATAYKTEAKGKPWPWPGRNLLGKSLMDTRSRLFIEQREAQNHKTARKPTTTEGDEEVDEDWVVVEDWTLL